MKRSSSPVTPPSSSEEPAVPSPTKRVKSTKSSPKKAATKGGDGGGGGGGVWTAEKYAKLSEKVFATAYQHMDKDALAAEVSEAHLRDKLHPSEKRADVIAVECDQGSIGKTVDSG